MTAQRSKKTPVRKGARRRRRIKVMVVDDHPMWRDTIRDVLHRSGIARVVAETADGTEVVRVAKDASPDVVVMDMGLPTVSGGAATRALLRAIPGLKVLVLSASDRRPDVLEAIDSGASGYLLKTAAPEQVVDANGRVVAGETVFPPELAGTVLDELRRRSTEPSSAERYRVAIGDRSVLVREGLKRILCDIGHDVIASVSGSRELIDAVDTNSADIVIVDEDLPRVRDGDAQLHPAVVIHRHHPHAAIVVLSERVDAPVALALLDQGSHGIGYLLRDRINDPDQIVDVVRRVARGDPAVDPEVVRRLVDAGMSKNPLAELTPRELEVLGLMAEGRSNQAIREHLHLTAKTVETHVRSIFTKLRLEPAADEHRRVKAVITYLRSS